MKRKNFDKKTLLVFHLINTDTFVAYKEANRVLPTQGHRVTPDSLRKKKIQPLQHRFENDFLRRQQSGTENKRPLECDIASAAFLFPVAALETGGET